jgi:hypothetical protein
MMNTDARLQTYIHFYIRYIDISCKSCLVEHVDYILGDCYISLSELKYVILKDKFTIIRKKNKNKLEFSFC